jgi:pyruvate kinase
MRQTKIIATLGPASSTDEQIARLIDAGVDVFRLNFSHGSYESHGQAIARIRAAGAASGRAVSILQDLSGPKIRTGRLRGGVPLQLAAGDTLRIAVGDFEGSDGRVSTAYADLPGAVRPGDALLLDDGRIQLRVESIDGSELMTTVVDGGLLGEHKGINAPGVALPAVGLTAKDAQDLQFGVAAGVDFMALSFVQTPDDLRQARAALEREGAPHLPLVAKLERPQAIECLDEILHASDAVMVARGDLGLELPLEHVPRVQKENTRRARALGIPVIVATQVLESMRTEPRPTRAEVSDAANAVDDGVDAIMLAGETAVGAYPVRAVQTLDAIIRDAESSPPITPIGPAPFDNHLLRGHGRAICEAAVTLAQHAGAAAIVAVTHGGKTARVLSALRPRAAIFGATDQPDISRRLTMAWGVVPVLTDLSGDVSERASRINEDLVARGAIERGATIVLVSINPDLAKGPSNFLKVQRV